MNWSAFFTRSGTAIVFAIVMLAGLLGHALLFSALFLLVQFLCIKEYFSLFKNINGSKQNNITSEIVLQFFGAALLLLCSPIFEGQKLFVPALLFIPTVILLWQALHAKGNIQNAFQTFGAMLYIILPILLLILMREKSLLLPLGLVLMIWVNDTMAYIVGSLIGKTPFSTISPKKTWEGTIGGALLTVIVASIWGYYSPYYHIQDWLALSLCASVAGTLGDLLESKLKRLAEVKDSGSFMPGHGGALDRFDSLLVATPFAFAYSYLFMDSLKVLVF
ncbi:MAG: phosphatidate cytidylyltransferase [Phycisphaerales bacterium]|nr:phosphatidate cytidylyltransferase [Phycisphaerales bacterium]